MIVFPLRTWSPNEVRFQTRWGARAWSNRHKFQKQKTMLELQALSPRAHAEEAGIAREALRRGHGLLVTLTRFSPSNGLDTDNLAASLKHTRDGVAMALGVPNDNDPRFRWHYEQSRSGYGIHQVGISLIPVIG